MNMLFGLFHSRLMQRMVPVLGAWLMLASCDSPFSIRGTFSGGDATDSVWVELRGLSQPLIRSVEVKNGSFEVEIDHDSVDFVSLISPRMASACSFVPVRGERCLLTISGQQGEIVEVSGNDEARDYYAFRRQFADACRERASLCEYMERVKADSLALYQQLLLRDTMAVADAFLTARVKEFVESRPNSPYGALALADLLAVTRRFLPTYDWVRAKAHEKVLPHSLYQELYRTGQNSLFSLKGLPFPEFSFRLSSHQNTSMSQYRRSSHLLICFWDPAEPYSCFVAKQISAMGEEYKNYNTRMLFIAVTNDHGGWTHTIDSLHLKGVLGVVSPVREPDLLSDCGISQLPATLFLTREDRIQFENLFAAQLSDSLNVFLNVK